MLNSFFRFSVFLVFTARHLCKVRTNKYTLAARLSVRYDFVV